MRALRNLRAAAVSCFFTGALLGSSSARAADGGSWLVGARSAVEFGALAVAYHHIQFGSDGSEFDYRSEGGQDVLFPFARLNVEFALGGVPGRHRVSFLYQPLELSSRVVLRSPLVVDGQTFPEQTPMDLSYGFPFYRASYGYDVVQDPAWEVLLGGGLQVRNATITFSSADGELRRTNRDVGPVPLLKLRVRRTFETGWFFATEIDGFYAPIKYLNGGDSDVEGAILDASLRAGHALSDRVEAFVNLRWIGGGAEGTSKEEQDFGDGYTQNWLHFLTLSLGVDFALL